jgi:hypothetical protein
MLLIMIGLIEWPRICTTGEDIDGDRVSVSRTCCPWLIVLRERP